MTVKIGTLTEIVKHGDTLYELLATSSTPQTVARLKALIEAPHLVAKLMNSLERMHQAIKDIRNTAV